MTINSGLKGNWNDQKSKLKKKFPALTDKDLFFEIGRKNEMLANLQVKLDKTKEELQQIIEAL
ncbi:general stress protein CsbD [Niastella caeni]|uniref:General stress protein CsbD n=1 Tax=Niastella caeni TaxID=2569763 RepID=A0A4S8HYP6_9BACT|nr:general stress protein CsbD [Niastella caeni]THU40461.1 general stress protein CsbD [Niastella caeni]